MINDIATEPTSAEDVGSPGARPTIAQRLSGVAAYIRSRGARDRGMLAELRRVTPERIPPQPFWEIVERYAVTPAEEDFFLRVVPAMVLCPHVRGTRPGRTLRSAGVSPARLERWLRMNRPGALRECRRILAQVKGGVDWGELGRVLFQWDHPAYGPEQRRRLARDFYLSTPSVDRNPDHTGAAHGDDE